jgi:hypothetical protein
MHVHFLLLPTLPTPAGFKVGVVGRTGAGKSSLIGTLFRLTEIDSGCITVDHINTKLLGLRQLRSAMALIPQVRDRRLLGVLPAMPAELLWVGKIIAAVDTCNGVDGTQAALQRYGTHSPGKAECSSASTRSCVWLIGSVSGPVWLTEAVMTAHAKSDYFANLSPGCAVLLHSFLSCTHPFLL